mgnify:CR=1 FL=1
MTKILIQIDPEINGKLGQHSSIIERKGFKPENSVIQVEIRSLVVSPTNNQTISSLYS